jgi:GT2 family glycosyltransferase
MLATAGQFRAGGVAAKVLFAHDPGLINSAGLVLYRDGRGGDRGFRQRDDGRFDAAEEVFGACGAGALYRRDMIDDVGFFDPSFFMYYEDLDLAWRARRRGWRFAYAPKAVVHHVHCASAGEWSPRFSFYVERNRVLTSLRNGSLLLALWACLGLVLRTLRCWLRVSLLWRTKWRPAHGVAYLRALGSVLAQLPATLAIRRRLSLSERVPPSSYRKFIERAPAESA